MSIWKGKALTYNPITRVLCSIYALSMGKLRHDSLCIPEFYYRFKDSLLPLYDYNCIREKGNNRIYPCSHARGLSLRSWCGIEDDMFISVCLTSHALVTSSKLAEKHSRQKRHRCSKMIVTRLELLEAQRKEVKNKTGHVHKT